MPPASTRDDAGLVLAEAGPSWAGRQLQRLNGSAGPVGKWGVDPSVRQSFETIYGQIDPCVWLNRGTGVLLRVLQALRRRGAGGRGGEPFLSNRYHDVFLVMGRAPRTADLFFQDDPG